MEPIGDWGDGGVVLFEIPTKEEVHDNIAAFWRPKAPLQAKGEHNLLTACIGDRTPPGRTRWLGSRAPGLARVAKTPGCSSSICSART
jgi:glucan biosynthesis protein